MKILVYGAGVVGSYYAARLQSAGNEVTIVARRGRADEIREHGIVLEAHDDQQRSVVPVNVVEALSPNEFYDLVIIAVRRNQISGVLPSLGANTKTPNLLFLGNNSTGPDEMVATLGRNRVLLGFGAVAGVKQSYIIRYLAETPGESRRVIIGEIDGSETPRLRRIAWAFERTEFQVLFEKDIVSWLITHAAVIIPFVYALYLANGDNYRLARTRDGVVLALRAVRECFKVLQTHKIPITPKHLRVFDWVPEPLLVTVVRGLMNTRRAELGLAAHANAAHDEMHVLAQGLQDLIRRSSVPTAAFDQLMTYDNPVESPMLDARSAIPLDWSGVWASLGSAAVGLLVLRRILFP